MKERPILFSAPMVRAILSGTKTQTRRAVKPVGNDDGFVLLNHGDGWWPYRSDDGDSSTHTVKRGGKLYQDETPHTCPYGQPGDRLWVRESWGPCDGGFCYRSDEDDASNAKPDDGHWHPSIHMPRWACRITLEVVSVRVERLQDITAADAISEGIDHAGHSTDVVRDYSPDERFSMLWEYINGPGSWNANPWVWVVQFKVVKP